MAANLLGLPPHKLREVAPLLEVCHVGAVLAIIAGGEEVHLAVVPAVAGRASDGRGGAKGLGVLGRAPHGKVLTVAAAANFAAYNVSQRWSPKPQYQCCHSRIVLKNASRGQRLGVTSNLIVPLDGAGGMVEAVDIVVVDGGARVVRGLCGLILGRRRGGLGRRVRLGCRVGRGLGRLGRLDSRRSLGGRLGFGRGSGLGSGFNDGLGGGSGRRGRRGRQGGARRLCGCGGRSGLGPGVGAAEGRRSIAVSYRDGDPLGDDIGLDVNLAALENGAGNGQDGAASGEED